MVISAKLNEAEATATLIHEIAHIELDHVKDLDAYKLHRGEMEVAAESVAYVVGEVLGLDAENDKPIWPHQTGNGPFQ